MFYKRIIWKNIIHWTCRLINLITGSNNSIEFQTQIEQETMQITELQQDKEYNVDRKRQTLKRITE